MTHTLNLAKRMTMSLAAAALCLFAVQSAQASAEVYEKTLQSTTWVIGTKGTGSGVLLSVDEKTVLTNYHVVRDDQEVTVFFPTQRGGVTVGKPSFYVENAKAIGIKGEVVAKDVKRDLALIRLKSLPAGVAALGMAAKSAKPGETVHAIGNSGVELHPSGKLVGTLWRYSEGKVRQVYDTEMKVGSPDGFTLTLEAKVLESQLPTNPGDSGGPVVNDKGELVGLTQSGMDAKRLVTYSVDVTEIKAFLAEYEKNKDTAKKPEPAPTKVEDPKPTTDAQKPAKRNPDNAKKD